MSLPEPSLPPRSTCSYCRGNCDHDSGEEAMTEWMQRYMNMDERIFRNRFEEASRNAEASPAMRAAAVKRGIEL